MGQGVKLGKRTVDAIQPGPVTVVIWDSELRGFGLKVTPAGHKSYVFRYRVGGGRGGRSREPVIGPHGRITPDAARRIAEGWARSVAEGGDPAGARGAQRAAPTMAELFERYLRDHAGPHKKRSSARMDEANIRNRLVPAFGRRKVAELTSEEVDRWHKSMASTPYLANRCLALLGKALSLAELWNWREKRSNPTYGIRKFAEKKRKRFLTAAELAALGAAMRRAEAGELGDFNAYAIAALRLLALTGARKREVLDLRWAWIDWERGCARLPDSKSGEKELPLGAPALAALRAIPRKTDRITGPNGETLEVENPHVFAGERPGAALVNIDDAWRAIRAAAGLADVRIHDLRHSFASVGTGGGISLPIIGALLGHSQPSTTARYAHLADDPRRAAADSIAETVAAALDGAGAEVIALRPKHG